MATQLNRQEIIDLLTTCGGLSYQDFVNLLYSIPFLNELDGGTFDGFISRFTGTWNPSLATAGKYDADYYAVKDSVIYRSSVDNNTTTPGVSATWQPITSIGGELVAFDPTVVAPGGTLPIHATPAWLFVGAGTFNKPGGGTIVTTEQINIVGTNGTTYSLLLAIPLSLSGYATSASLAALAATVTSMNVPVVPLRTSFITPKRNLFNLNDTGVVLGSQINYVTGATNVNASYNATEFIPVSGSTAYTQSFKTHFAWYDNNKVYISGETSTGVANYTATSPANAAYFRSSVPVAKWNTWQFEAGTVANSFEAYKYIFNDKGGVPFDLSAYLPAIIDDLTSTSAVNPLSAGQGKILNDKISAIGVTSQFTTYGSSTANELLIRSAIKKIALSGDGIPSNKTYYLARMAYKVTANAGINDIYFRIQDQDGVIVAFMQINSTSADVGLVEYNFTYAGNTAKVVIDWTNIPANFIYSTGTNVRMQLIPSTYIFSNLFVGAKVTNVADGTAASDAVNYGQLQAASIPIQLKQNKNSYKRVGNILYIGAKWDDANDIIIAFSLSMSNNLMTFSSVGLAANATKTPLLNCDRTITTTLASTSSDNIGPVQIDGVFVGGNHLQDVSNVNTAKNNSFSFFADGYPIVSGDNAFADELIVNVQNEIYNPNTLSSTVKDVNVIESVTYRVKNGNIDVFLRHDFPLSANITAYYGMQSVGQTFQDNVFFAHSSLNDVTARIANVQSGIRSTYGNVERIMLCKSDRSICQSMLMDKTVGLGAATNANVIGTDSLAFTTSTKTYFRLISTKAMAAGSYYFWRGTYSWFKQLSLNNSNTIFGFVAKRGNDTLAIADFKGASSKEKITVPERFKLNDAIVLQADSGCVVDPIVGYNGVDITASNAGTVMVKIS